jgi:hypothetical protein
MAWLEIQVRTATATFLIVLGIPAFAGLLLFGLGCLSQPFNPDGGAVAGLVFCGVGTFLLLMAIAAFRGILHRKEIQKENRKHI